MANTLLSRRLSIQQKFFLSSMGFLLEETFSLTFDKSFVYNGDTISGLTNIFDIAEIRDEINMYENHMAFCSMGADKVIEFSNDFFENSTFDTTEYEVDFSCETSDGLTFSQNITIEFEYSQHLTMYKNNSRYSSKSKGCSPLQLSCNLTGKCHAVGYYSYT